MKNNYQSFLHLMSLQQYESCEDKIYKFLLKVDFPNEQLRSVGLDYYFIKKQSSLREIGKMYNVTQERIRQILCKFIRLLLKPYRFEYLKAELNSQYKLLIDERDSLEKRLNAVNMELRGFDSLDKDIGLNSSIKRLEFSVRTSKVLANAGIKTIKQLSEMSRNDLLCLRNCGEKSVREIEQALDSSGLDRCAKCGRAEDENDGMDI